MNLPATLEIPSEEDRYKPIPTGTHVNVKLGHRIKDGETFPLGDFHSGTTQNGAPYFIVPLVVADGEYANRRLSLFVNWSSGERNVNFLASLYEAVTGENLKDGGQIDFEKLVEGFKTGIFEVEVKIQKNNPQYNDVSRLIARVGEADHPSTDDVSIPVDDAPVDDGDIPF